MFWECSLLAGVTGRKEKSVRQNHKDAAAAEVRTEPVEQSVPENKREVEQTTGKPHSDKSKLKYPRTSRLGGTEAAGGRSSRQIQQNQSWRRNLRILGRPEAQIMWTKSEEIDREGGRTAGADLENYF